MNSTKIDLENSGINGTLAEFYGILVGDGCICKHISRGTFHYSIRIDGNVFTDFEYYRHCVINLIHKLTKRSPKIYYRNDCNGIYITFQSKEFASFLNKELDFPFGVKGDITLADKIINDINLLRCTLRGFFDTDGSLYFTKNDYQKIRSYPIIELSTHSFPLLKQLENILNSLNFTTKISHYRDSIKLHGKKNLYKWFKIIGSNHPDKHSKLAYWEKYGHCPKITELSYSERIRNVMGP